MISKNGNMIAMKTQRRKEMNQQKVKDVRETAMDLNKIYVHCPEDFFFLKGWIHCLLQKEDTVYRQLSEPSKSDCTAI